MEVKIMAATEKPIDVISLAAGMSTNKYNVNYKRVEDCIKLNHSVSEFANVTFKIEGISRSCLAQLTRHRMASFCVESQRYVKYNNLVNTDDWYVIPSSIQDNNLEMEYKENMKKIAALYEKMLKSGVRAEDARFILPESTKTNLMMTINVRSLMHFFKQRRDKHAQWEIHKLADLMLETIQNYNSQWSDIITIYLTNEDMIA